MSNINRNKNEVPGTGSESVKTVHQPELKMTLRRALKEARVRAGLTQAQIAEKMGTTQSAVARLEKVGPMPRMASLIKYASATNSRLRIFLEPEKPEFEEDKLFPSDHHLDLNGHQANLYLEVAKKWEKVRKYIRDIENKARFESKVKDQQAKRESKPLMIEDRYFFRKKRKFLEVLENFADRVGYVNLDTRKSEHVSVSSQKYWSPSPEADLSGDPRKILFSFVHPDDRRKISQFVRDSVLNRRKPMEQTLEYRQKTRGGKDYLWFSMMITTVVDGNDRPVAMVYSITDITARKNAEQDLQKSINELERKVKNYSEGIEQTNTALRILLRQNQKEKEETEEKVLFNIKELVAPVVEKLKHCRLENMKDYIGILESNLNQITSALSSKLTSKLLNLSHQEIQVGNYITYGKTSKEISDMMGLSEKTIDFHRAKIRKKLGLTNKKENLRTYLLSLQ